MKTRLFSLINFLSLLVGSARGDSYAGVNFVSLPLDMPRGESYRRPIGASKFALEYVPVETSVTCSSQQVHVSLGDSDDSVFISFVSSNATETGVLYSPFKSGVQYNVPALVNVSYESFISSYSQLLYIRSYLYDPYMGAPSEDIGYIFKLENSSVWAYSVVDGEFEPWGNYVKLTPTSSVTGLGAYNNPYMIYDSPIIHQVTLRGLTPGKKYYYKPLSSCMTFSFTLPAVSDGTEKSYPLLVGLAADLGQTAVSNSSINALIAMNPSVVLLPGDLSYSDGFYALWDTFGSLFEPLAANIPVLTTG